jgi:hypothetical protein
VATRVPDGETAIAGPSVAETAVVRGCTRGIKAQRRRCRDLVRA